jgi:hypothetical protein
VLVAISISNKRYRTSITFSVRQQPAAKTKTEKDLKKMGNHKKSGRRKAFTRSVAAAGGAALCVGVAAEIATPTADALSLVLPFDVNGNGNVTQVNFLEGNIIDPQTSIFGDNVSSNTTVGNLALFNGIGNTGDNEQFGGGGGSIFGSAVNGNGNVTQINILSGNIFNPQASIFGSNVGNNTTVGNVSAFNGVGNTGDNEQFGAGGGGMFGLFGATNGNGNTNQMNFLSNNIINPQMTFFGSNVSNNTAIGNVSAFNGIFNTGDNTQIGGGGGLLFGATNGNGNTNQMSMLTTNIFNPQLSGFGSNTSGNTSITNLSIFNGGGNTGDNEQSAGPSNNTNGNGNNNQASNGSGSITSPQLSFRPPPIVPFTATTGTQRTASAGGGNNALASAVKSTVGKVRDALSPSRGNDDDDNEGGADE